MGRVQTLALVASASLAAHVGIASAIAAIRKPPQKRPPTAIEVRAVKKKPAPPKPEPPKPVEPPQKAEPIAKVEAKPKAEPPQAKTQAAVANAAAPGAIADLGISMGNGPGGIAVPVGGGPAAPTPAPAPPASAKVLVAKLEECPDPPSKPKPVKVVQPSYTSQAREAQIEGRVRVEITVDELGRVANVRLIAGLGHGLDEAALEAARASSFEAATRCGKTVASTFVLGMRFSL